MRFCVTHVFTPFLFLKTFLDISVRIVRALWPILAFLGALSSLALNFSLQRTLQATSTLSLRGLITRWAGTRSVTSLGRPVPGSGAGAGAGPGTGPAGVGGFGAIGSFSLRLQASATSTLDPCWALSPTAGPGGGGGAGGGGGGPW